MSRGNNIIRTANGGTSAFTMVEVLVALAFMAIVIPVIVEGLKLSATAGEVSQRKAMAMHVAEKVLNETIVAGRWNMGSQKGNEQGSGFQYQWTVRNEAWNAIATATSVNTVNGINQGAVNANNLHVLTVDVTYPAQGQNYAVHLSTVVDVSRQITANPPPTE